jgi:polyribonucleotide nucleotidyltransferase
MIPGLSDANALSKNTITRTYSVGGREITLESGSLARLAQGSCVIRDTAGNYLLTTAGISLTPKQASFFPLTVEFVERFYATGKIGGNKFNKREARPSESAILNSRLIDRPIRPMFPSGVQNEVQIIATILSSSGVSDFGFYGITGTSLSLMLAGVAEFEGPVAGARIALTTTGEMIFDPTFAELAAARIDLTLAGTVDAITMVEAQAGEASEAEMLQVFEYGHACIRELIAAQQDFVQIYKEVHALPLVTLTCSIPNEDTVARVRAFVTQELIAPLFNTGKSEFHDRLTELEDATIAHLALTTVDIPLADSTEWELSTQGVPSDSEIREIVYSVVKWYMRQAVLEQKIRLDGRTPKEIRPLRSSVEILPRTHGSALFERGITQILSVATLGGPGDIQIVDDLYEESSKRYIHHYNFPPYSVGEVKPLRWVWRREVGHGRLAEKALEPVLPSLVNFPYFIRVVSETMTCNGSSSMASVCGSSLALMDAGVPISRPVAGIAMGMIYDEATHEFVVLSDIQAQEDFLGDLDFKIAATKQGITALQMDCKIAGLSLAVISAIFAQARVSLGEIRASMALALSTSRKDLSAYAPSIFSILVPEAKMREVIGKGGEMIQSIERDYKVEVNLADDGQCSITARNQATGQAALAAIARIIKDDEVGDMLSGKIVKILDGVGAIVEWAKWKSGMLHISKLGVTERVEDISQYLAVGQEVNVKIITIDKEKGRIGLERVITTI